jgi:hypothetical protein
MSKIIFKLSALSFLTTIGLFLGFYQLNAVSAATLSFSPAQTTVEQGKDFTVTIFLNAGSIYANAVGINVSYPKDKLEARSITTSGSVLTIFAEKIISDGSIRISGGTPTPGFAGQKTIASINFRAKVASGSAQIKFASGTVVLKDSDNTNFLDLTNSGMATVSFKAVSAGSSTSSAPGKDTEPPQINDIEVKDITKNSATISWKTDEDSDSLVEYDFASGQYKFAWTSSTATKDHVALITDLPAGEKFYFAVSSRDAAGNIAKSSEQTFTLAGYQAQIKYLSLDGKPLSGVEVSLFYTSDKIKSGLTDAEGKIIFENVMPGDVLVIAKYGDSTLTNRIKIRSDKNFQLFEFRFSYMKEEIGLFTVLGVSAVLVAILLFVLLKLAKTFKKKHNKEENKIDSMQQ